MIVVPSRFARLKIVQDDYKLEQVKATKKGEASSRITNDKPKKSEKLKKPTQPVKNTKVKPEPPINGLQNGHCEKKKKSKNTNNVQWEEWKQRDIELENERFHNDMLQALKLSSIEFEAHEKQIEHANREAKVEVKDKEAGKKNKKNKPLTLSQFAEMCELESSEKEVSPKTPTGLERNSFIDLDNEALLELERSKELEKKRIEKMKRLDLAKHRIEKFLERQSPSLEEIKQSQLNVTLEEKEQEICGLKDVIAKMESELVLVKTRNRKLCNIIGQGEMKAKANLLMEMEQVKEVHAELNSEVERLNALLQQERSRCTCSHRQDKKKRSVNDA